jgi:hypothetical protein
VTICQLDPIAYEWIIYAVIAIERLDIPARDDNLILRIGKGFLHINIYIQRIDKSYVRLKDAGILEVFIGIAEKNVCGFHI